MVRNSGIVEKYQDMPYVLSVLLGFRLQAVFEKGHHVRRELHQFEFHEQWKSELKVEEGLFQQVQYGCLRLSDACSARYLRRS